MRQPGLGPILIKEFLIQLRGSRAALLITIYVGVALIAMRLVYSSIAGQINAGPPIFSAQIGQAVFIGLALAVQTLTVFLAPATTVNSISGEFERRTYDLLQATPISIPQLLLGKLLAGMAFLALLLLSVLPLFSIVMLFGGVAMIDLLRVLVTIAASAIVGGILGLLCSAITRQTYSATLLCYAILVAVIGGTLFASSLYSLTHATLPAPPSYVVANPLSAVGAALGRTRPPDTISSETLRPLILLSLVSQGALTQENGERIILPLYRATLTLYGGLSLVFFWLCLHLAQPSRQWMPRRIDGLMLALVAVYGLGAWLASPWWMQGLGW